MAIFSKSLNRWNEQYAAGHQGLDPSGVTWRQSYEWDEAHSNHNDLAREADLERYQQAFELFEAKDYEPALAIWLDQAANGSVCSMVAVGSCYENGYIAEPDPAAAQQWFCSAFKAGSQLGMLGYARTAAARRDFDLCDHILEGGVKQDWTPAIFWQAWYRHKQSESKATYRTILPHLRKAARRGHPAARMFYSSLMVRGKFGLHRIPFGFLLAVKTSWEEASADTWEEASLDSTLPTRLNIEPAAK